MRKLLAISIFIIVSGAAMAAGTNPVSHLKGATSESTQKPMQEVGPANSYRPVQDTCVLPNGQISVQPNNANSGSSSTYSPSASYSGSGY